MAPQLQSTITCPKCGYQATEIMPTDACVFFYNCNGCGEKLKPLPGSCCVFCSYGSVPCPPTHEGVEPCCVPKPNQSSKDWVGSKRMALLAWWLPSAAIAAGLFAPIPARMLIWSIALAWMGIACLLNAQQCGRTHCRYTGPFYLAMIVRGVSPLCANSGRGILASREVARPLLAQAVHTRGPS